MTKTDVSEIFRSKEDNSLYNSFMLTEIKSKDDSLRHLMSINIILLGAYITILTNLVIKLSDINIKQFEVSSDLMAITILLIVVGVILLPLILWFGSTSQIMDGLEPSRSLDSLLNSSTSSDFLKEINENKFSVLKKCSERTFSALVIILFMVEIVAMIIPIALVKPP
jgi:hypothetical protein